VIFRNNGYASLMRGGEEVPIDAAEPFSAEWNAAPHTAEAPAVEDDDAEMMSAKKRSKDKKRFLLRAGAVGISAVGLIICGVNLSQMNDNFKRYDRERNPYLSTTHRNNVNMNITMSSVGAIMAGAGVACIGVTLFW